jgi:tetratricopeptide (TPR) repeat protein
MSKLHNPLHRQYLSEKAVHPLPEVQKLLDIEMPGFQIGADRAPLRLPPWFTAKRWAMTQMNLGNALQTLGERESGTTRLEQAVSAYQEALKEQTRERAPLDWATTQNNLGSALSTLGEHESGTARLEEAVAAFRAALEERTRDRVPLDWATTQNNLGHALRALGKG